MGRKLEKNTIIGGKYRLGRVLGEGGLGQVWSATHHVLGGEFALKFLMPSKSGNDVATRLLREARASAAVQSEHVCRVFDVGTHDEMPYLVMERLDGEDLGSLLRWTKTVSPALAAELVRQACDGLAEAHDLGIFHRDLKPENLFIEWRGALPASAADTAGAPFVKIVDFGLATEASVTLDKLQLTVTSATFGTPLYMAPEQMQSAKNASAQSDIWSLGVVLFYASTGRYPYIADSFHELCLRLATERAPSLRAVWPRAPLAFADAVDRCLAYEPIERFANARELAAALAPIAAAEPRPTERRGYPKMVISDGAPPTIDGETQPAPLDAAAPAPPSVAPARRPSGCLVAAAPSRRPSGSLVAAAPSRRPSGSLAAAGPPAPPPGAFHGGGPKRHRFAP